MPRRSFYRVGPNTPSDRGRRSLTPPTPIPCIPTPNGARLVMCRAKRAGIPRLSLSFATAGNGRPERKTLGTAPRYSASRGAWIALIALPRPAQLLVVWEWRRWKAAMTESKTPRAAPGVDPTAVTRAAAAQANRHPKICKSWSFLRHGPCCSGTVQTRARTGPAGLAPTPGTPSGGPNGLQSS